MSTDVAIAQDAVEELRTRIRGVVAQPGDPEAATVREAFNAMHQAVPAATVRPSGATDVAAAITFARHHGLEIAVRGGGHSIAGLSTTAGGLLIDLSLMDGVHIDPERRRAIAQGGALWGAVDREAQAFGLIAPGGVVSHTGVGGLTLGGGYGWVRRKYGLSIDSLVEAQVVGADGVIRTASQTVNPDLFWALRGGGGNFGVVTTFVFDLHPLGPDVAFSATFYAVEDMAEVLRGWRAYTESAPNDVSSMVVAITFPADPSMPEEMHDRGVAIVAAVHAGEVEEGMRATAPLRALAEPVFDISGPTPFTAVQTGFDGFFPRNQLQTYWKSEYVAELGDDVIDIVAARANARPAPLSTVEVWHMGGAIARVDPASTAFAARSAPYMVSIDGIWTNAAANDAMVAWVRSVADAVRPYATGDVYLNFTGAANEDPGADVSAAFGQNLTRLAAVKATYDPESVFHRTNTITPAS